MMTFGQAFQKANRSLTNTTVFSLVAPCDTKEKAYLAIIITVLPLWAILTTLIVLVLLAFHRNFRLTKIYDNCNKHNAQYTYYLELRTGDTSPTYNRRRTTLSIDLFDDTQATLARIAIPGHVMFGRKEAPISVIEDEKFFDLRVTRVWLYRATRLRNVSTIRLTHSGQEPDSRLMVYGVEIRSNEHDRHKLFFPVMNYITNYGCANKPNACFDLDTGGSIGEMGGTSHDVSPISNNLTLVDYSFLVYLFAALTLFTSAHELIDYSWMEPTQASYKGLIIGGFCFACALVLGLILRYFIKRQFSRSIGMGVWSCIYYTFLFLILLTSTAFWIYTTVIAYKDICPSFYNMWLLSISVAVIGAIFLAILCLVLSWGLHAASSKHHEQYILHDDVPTYHETGTGAPMGRSKSNTVRTAQHSASTKQQQQQMQMASQMMAPDPAQHPGSWPPMGAPQAAGAVPMQYYIQSHPGYPPPNPYAQVIYNPMVSSPPQPQQAPPQGYKALPQYNQPYAGYYTAQGPLSPSAAALAQQQQQPQKQQPMQKQPQQQQEQQQTYHQQTTTKSFKKIGSNESTGSTYYQQIMKNKGGVKSISQYGELLRQKRAPKK